MSIGEKLAALRKKHNYTQEKLAAIIGVSRQAISKWESDGAFPETDKLIQLSNLYGCSLDYLLKEEETYEHVKKDDFRSKKVFTKKPTFYALCWVTGIFLLNIIVYLFPYVSGTVVMMNQTVNIKENVYGLLGAPNYQFGNFVILFAFILMVINTMIGVVISLQRVSVNGLKVRRVLSIMETVLWSFSVITLIGNFHIGMIFVLGSCITNLYVLYKVPKFHITYNQVST